MKRHLLSLVMVFSGFLLNAQNIYNGQTLQQNRKYWGTDNGYYLMFQNDGNLVLYTRDGSPVWDTKTTDRGVKAVFQEDGNLVVYTPANGVAFTSNTYGKGADRLTVQDDGNLVIYNGSNPLWASKSGGKPINNNSRNDYGFRRDYVNKGYKLRGGEKLYSSNGNYYLIFQNDGNLVLSNRNGNAIWGAGTERRGDRAEFQNDGNLVIYDRYNKSIWSSNTFGKGAEKLMVQNDGNLVIYGRNLNPVWSTGTQR
ncbi:curculin domain-containing protein [Chryseobacterium lactis]|uniref:Curculin domain-containing protein n=1 Tax=Chryseobacterium lactis TaxID=1241981 RepID=A0A3G6RFG0_CHRLC|nr:curculin domain-containing protein [Chryseobacterium lactis]AZA83407.1 curculin domain-containing protein [Chryseobacterium lactis]AZB03791.1 curculin domain-containing protein [Chryseobacterium lactis]PNW11632.1 curculin domain-containing protein [Chryseobacterium lactis]